MAGTSPVESAVEETNPVYASGIVRSLTQPLPAPAPRVEREEPRRSPAEQSVEYLEALAHALRRLASHSALRAEICADAHLRSRLQVALAGVGLALPDAAKRF